MTDSPRLDDMRLFAQLASAGSITGAAVALDMPKQTVSRRLHELEAALGVELARRSSRKLVLTQVGQAYASRCAQVVRLADEANRAASSELDTACGMLRVTADHSFGEAFLPGLIAEFLDQNPEVNIEIELTARKVDLLEEGFDVAFRVGPPPNVAHLAATRLGPARLWMVASPGYLQRVGDPPKQPEDLAGHDLLALVPAMTGRVAWPLARDGCIELYSVAPRLRVNGLANIVACVHAGLGIAQLPEFAAAAGVASGDMLRVLAAYTPEVGGINIVYPHTRLLAPRVRAFVEASSLRLGRTGATESSPRQAR